MERAVLKDLDRIETGKSAFTFYLLEKPQIKEDATELVCEAGHLFVSNFALGPPPRHCCRRSFGEFADPPLGLVVGQHHRGPIV